MTFLLCMIIGHRREVAGTHDGYTLYRCKTCGRYNTRMGEVTGRFE